MDTLVETESLIVKIPTLEDFNHYVQLYSDPGVRSLMYTKAKDEAEILQWLDVSIAHQERFGFTVGCVFDKSMGEFMGRSGLLHLENEFSNPIVELDCYLLPKFWRKHYGKVLCNAFIQWGFANLEIDSIVATINHKNKPAIKLAESVGMKYIGDKPYLDTKLMWFEIIRNELSFNKNA